MVLRRRQKRGGGGGECGVPDRKDGECTSAAVGAAMSQRSAVLGKRKPARVMENLECWQQRAGDLWQLYELKELHDSTASRQGLQLVDRPPLPRTSLPALLGVWWHVHLPDLVSLPTPDLSRQHPGCHQASFPGGTFQTSPQILQCSFPLSLSGKRMNGGQRLPISREFPLLAPAC